MKIPIFYSHILVAYLFPKYYNKVTFRYVFVKARLIRPIKARSELIRPRISWFWQDHSKSSPHFHHVSPFKLVQLSFEKFFNKIIDSRNNRSYLLKWNTLYIYYNKNTMHRTWPHSIKICIYSTVCSISWLWQIS